MQEFLAARNPKQQHSSTLESYLIKPIQRILKYPLLLQQLRNLTDVNSEEHLHLVGEFTSLLITVVHDYRSSTSMLSLLVKGLWGIFPLGSYQSHSVRVSLCARGAVVQIGFCIQFIKYDRVRSQCIGKYFAIYN